MYNQGYIETIVSSFGRFLAVDKRTENFTNPSFARVCMELDVSKDLPEEVWISTGVESGFWQKIMFENCMQYCSKCKLHGHSIETCRKVKQQQADDRRIWAARDEQGFPTAQSLVSAPKVSADNPVKSTSLHISKPSDQSNAGWTLIQRKTRKSHNQKAQQHAGPTIQSCKENVDPLTTHITCQLHKSHSMGDLEKASFSINEKGSQAAVLTEESDKETSTLLQLSNQDMCTREKDQTKISPEITIVSSEKNGPKETNDESVQLVTTTKDPAVLPTAAGLPSRATPAELSPNAAANLPSRATAAELPSVNSNRSLASPICQPKAVPFEGAEVEQAPEGTDNVTVSPPADITQKIASYGNIIFHYQKNDRSQTDALDARGFYLRLKANHKEDAHIFQIMDGFIGLLQAQEEGSSSPVETEEDPVDLSRILKQPRQKTKGSRFSGRSCPKKKDSNFVY